MKRGGYPLGSFHSATASKAQRVFGEPSGPFPWWRDMMEEFSLRYLMAPG